MSDPRANEATPFYGWTLAALDWKLGKPDLVLIGTGSQFFQLPAFVTEYFQKNGIPVEGMSTVSVLLANELAAQCSLYV